MTRFFCFKMILYITGGIATGKSWVVSYLLSNKTHSKLLISQFDADLVVKQLLTNKEVKEIIAQSLGEDLLSSSNELNHDLLRSRVFSDRNYRLKLEDILHPYVWLDFVNQVEELESKNNDYLLIAEIPLYYETKNKHNINYPGLEVVVACESDTQLTRLKERGWSKDDSVNAIKSQMNLYKKIEKSDIVIWTDCKELITEKQIQQLVEKIGFNKN